MNGLDFRVNGLGFVQIPIVPSAHVAGTDANSQAVGLLIEHSQLLASTGDTGLAFALADLVTGS